MDQRSKALVLLRQIGVTHTIRQCNARSWKHTHDGHARTRDVNAHARSWQHAHVAHAHDTSTSRHAHDNTNTARTHTRRQCNARSWKHTHDGHARTRDVDTHARLWEHAYGTHACTRDVHAKHVREHTRTTATRECEHARTHAFVRVVVKGERCRYSMTATLECVSIAHQATLCDWRMWYSHICVVNLDTCRGQKRWVSTNN